MNVNTGGSIDVILPSMLQTVFSFDYDAALERNVYAGSTRQFNDWVRSGNSQRYGLVPR